MTTHAVFISTNGQITFIYDDDIAEALQTLGLRTDRRASHVEPDKNNPGQWAVDLSPVTVTALMLGPFSTRRQALQTEVEWLDALLDTYYGQEEKQGDQCVTS